MLAYLKRFIRHRGKGDCELTREKLSAYIDRRLSADEQSLVEKHLVSCAACREELDSLRAMVDLLHRVPQALPRRSFAIARVEPVPRRRALRALQVATAVMAIFLLGVFAGDLLNSFEATPLGEGGAPSQLDQGKGGEEEISPSPGERGLAGGVEEAGWLRPLELALLGVVIILGVMAFAIWWKGRRGISRFFP